jgi:hypothetical protein
MPTPTPRSARDATIAIMLVGSSNLAKPVFGAPTAVEVQLEVE